MVFLQKNIKTEFLKCSNEKAPGWGKNLIFPAGGFLLVLLYSFPITVSSTALLSLLQIQVFQAGQTYFSYMLPLQAGQMDLRSLSNRSYRTQTQMCRTAAQDGMHPS